MSDPIQQLKELDKEITLLSNTQAILGWDQETMLPLKAIENRSEQLSYLEGLIHDKNTTDTIGELLEKAGSTDNKPEGPEGLQPQERAFLREIRRRYTRGRRIPKDLVVRIAKEVSISQNVWQQARKDNNFDAFAPHLENLVSMNKELSGHIGYTSNPYDALLDEFEPHMKTETIDSVFSQLEKQLKPILDAITDSPQVNDEVIRRTFPSDKQNEFGTYVLKKLGFDFDRGRLDRAAHPFTTSLGPHDIRLTTRYDENFFNTGIFGNIHEGGHGMYEQGFGSGIAGTILADTSSLGMHESQSRMWENIVGRSRAFWKHFLPKLKETFPGTLDDVSVDTFYKAVNKVEPSLIRVEADEVTYSMHIIIRFKLETALLNGTLQVKELPDAWNQAYHDLLGIEPSNNAEGVLQDIHWSMGAIGYFPTYALGNLYSAQFLSAMKKDMPDMYKDIEKGDFSKILRWLREHIHKYGKTYSSEEFCKRITGEGLNPVYFTHYLKDKYKEIYGI